MLGEAPHVFLGRLKPQHDEFDPMAWKSSIRLATVS
jgi:hypothetical protein